MKLTGKLEVFKNQNGYFTAVFKAWNDKNEVKGKAFMDVKLPESVQVKDGQTLTLDVKEAYLNAVHVEAGEKTFDKLKINVVDCEVISVYPEEKKPKKASKGAK